MIDWKCGVSNCGGGKCVHIQLDEICPSCENNKLIMVAETNWIFCPDYHYCEYERDSDELTKED